MVDTHTTNYGEIQDNEISALRSIFMEYFQEKEVVAGAWNKKADREFQIKLHPTSTLEVDDLSATLLVSFPATYPKSLPICKLQFDSQVPPKARDSITSLIREMPKQLVGSEMIYELASSIQEVLEEAASSLVQHQDLPALDEERTKQELEAQERAEKARIQRQKEQEIMEEEEDRVLSAMVQQERSRVAKLQERSPRQLGTLGEAERPTDAALSFDQDIKIRPKESSSVVVFRRVGNRIKYRRGPVTTVYTASPLPHEGPTEDSMPLLIVKSCSLKVEKKAIQALESHLDMLLQLPHHPSIMDLLAFRIIRISDEPSLWNVNILSSYAQGRSIGELLRIITKVDISNTRSWIIQILEGLDFLHRHHIAHARINPENILLETNETGTTVAKLADGGFQNEIHVLNNEGKPKFSSAESAYWLAPESSNEAKPRTAPPKDIWDLGVLLLQMLFGSDVQKQFHSPSSLMEMLDLSQSFRDILVRIFKADPKKRPSAFELLPNEFLRDDNPVLEEATLPLASRVISLTSNATSKPMRTRRESSQAISNTSRYAKDFVEAGRLGKGGFGEVVRARNRLDGSTYAIKKISQASTSALSSLLSEVMLLSRLNHPFIVRYYAAWIEEEGGKHLADSTVSSMSDTSHDSFGNLPTSNTLGLDFISSGGGYPRIEFGYDSDEEASSEAIEEENEVREVDEHEENLQREAVPLPPKRRTSSASTTSKVILYIQMEYCDKQTLRDLIGDLHSKTAECWRLFRQILEGLAHVHSNGVIHRDLKPENIFITLDETNTPRIRIGDFGLARPGDASGKSAPKGFSDPRLTASIGTSLYVAPEVRSSGGGSYNDKADMYSLGIILFEMSYPLKTAMERAKLLSEIRQPGHNLPVAFQQADKLLQGEIIESLLKHKLSERPSSQELLKSGKIPSQVEDETIRNALHSLSDKSSPFYTKLMNGLFSQMGEDSSVKDYTYDMDIGTIPRSADYLLLCSQIKNSLTMVFSRHGAVETQRQLLLPSSRLYDSAVKLLDQSGTVVQLPYDLTLPFARSLVKQASVVAKSYSFGNVFREAPAGTHPRVHREVDFDIVTENSLDLALREAEVIKVMDEIIDAVPALSRAAIVYHISHSKLLDAILLHCGIPTDDGIKQIISRLNIGQWTWAKIRNELRLVGVASTSLDDLMKFDFREPYETAVLKIRAFLQTGIEELESTFRHLEAVITYLDRFSVRRKVLLSPLSSVNEKFYKGNILFQCVSDGKRRKVLCAGGRYDSLIEEQRTVSKKNRHATGFNLAWETLLDSTLRLQEAKGKTFLRKPEEDAPSFAWRPKRCDVLIDSVDPAVLRSIGIQIIQELWHHDISAELIVDSDIQESKSYQQQNKDPHTPYDWIVLIKQDQTLRVRSLVRKEDLEIRKSELVNWLKGELRERARQEGRAGSTLKSQSHHVDGSVVEREANVTVLVAQNKSKKTNRRNVVHDALIRTAALSSSFLSAPVAALELKDEIFDALRDTRLSDTESWRRFIQAAPLAERQYLGQVHELLLNTVTKDTVRAVWLYNFRTRGCFLYDLGKGP